MNQPSSDSIRFPTPTPAPAATRSAAPGGARGAVLILLAVLLAGCQPGPFTIVIDEPAAPSLGRLMRPPVLDEADSEFFQLPEDAPDLPAMDGPLHLTMEQAVFLALGNNRALQVQRYGPLIAGTFEQLERAVYDPVVGAFVAASRSRVEQLSAATQDSFSVDSQQQQAGVDISQYFPTGTELALELTQQRSESSRTTEQYRSRAGVTLTQALLRGANYQANLVSLRQAQLDTIASRYELRGFAENLIAQVEETYWIYALAQREIEIFENSLELAQQQLREAEQRVEVGVVAPMELAAARAEVAQRREDLINARSNVETTRLRLLRLLNPESAAGWDRPVEVTLPGARLEMVLDPIDAHVQMGRRYRADLNEARLRLAQGQLEVQRTRQGLLPRLDLFLTLGKTGYAEAFGAAVRDMDGEHYDWAVQANFEYALGNRQAEALHRRARLTRAQAADSVSNLAQLVDLDVRTAYLEVQRAAQQVDATLATRELREETLRAETEKFRVGMSTSFLVAQAQRDYLASQIAEVRAAVNHRLALIDLYRMEGSLLLRRGIQAPGNEPADEVELASR